MRGLNLSDGDLALIHDYGATRLVRLSDPSRLAPEILREFTLVENPEALAFRIFYTPFTTPASVSPPDKAGYYLIALFGPLDPTVIFSLQAAGVRVLGTASPFGLLVKGDTTAIGNALKLCTTRGFRVVRDIFPLPIETRLSSILLRMALGEPIDLTKSNIVHTSDGKPIVRIFPFKDGAESITLGFISSYLTAAPPELSMGYSDAYVGRPEA